MEIKVGAKFVAKSDLSDYGRKIDAENGGIIAAGTEIVATKDNAKTLERLGKLGVIEAAPEPPKTPAGN